MIYKVLLLLLITIILSSCGTLHEYKDIITIDSQPRNLKVDDEKGKELGNTPFFHKAFPESKKIYIFKGSDSKNRPFKKSKTLNCGMEWEQSLIPAGALLAIWKRTIKLSH